jgi:hypothetical protein
MGDLTTYEFTDAALGEALKALGDTSTKIAGTLRALGFKGKRNRCKVCPIALYLLAAFPGADDVNVGDELCSVFRTVVDYVDVEHERICVPTPLAIACFVEDFDTGHYPQLDSEVSGVSAA